MASYEWPPVAGGGGGGSGTVTSVGLADGSDTPIFLISGSPVTMTGILEFTLATQAANTIFAGPSTGADAQPTFRALVAADLPFAITNLTDAGTDGITITNGTGAVIGAAPVTIAQHVADATHNGYLSSTDWSTFNSKQAALTIGNLTDAGTDGITVTGGTGAVIGSGTSIAQHVSDASHNGYLSSTDWSTFNSKQATISIGAFDTTPNASGLSLSGAAISLSAADGTHPGGVSAAAQTFGGVKTFSSAPVMSALTASQVVVTDSGKALASLPYATAPAASTLAEWDASKNLRANIVSGDLATTATAAGTTTLTVASKQNQQFTGTTTQTVVLPDATTLVAGQDFTIMNRSTGIVTVNANGGGLIQTMVGGSQAVITVVTVGTSAGTWDSQYSVSGIVAAVQPTIQKFTSGSGTYTTPAGIQYIRVRMIGGGGGGSGSGNGSATNGGNGGNTTFGSSLLTANGGNGATAGTSASGGTGGTASLGSGPIGTALTGGSGGSSGEVNSIGIGFWPGGTGASTPFGGQGGSNLQAAGNAGITNTGGGGGGGGTGTGTVGQAGGAGGGAGGYVDAIIASPSATYSYAVGAAGTKGNAGTSGFDGAAGGSGYIEVTEYYTNFSVGSTTTVAAGTFLAGPTSGSAAAPTFRALQAPTIQKFTSGSGTYTTAAGALYIRVRMVGGGGGGGGSGTAGTGTGGTGGNTTFGTTLLAANGGTGGQIDGTNGQGGTASLGSGPIGTALSGGDGANAGHSAVTTVASTGGMGASTPFGGGGANGYNSTGGTPKANTGAGGGGGGLNGNAGGSEGGCGGGAGGYVDAIITSPAATYSYAIGAAGTAGTAGTSGAAGGAGAAGYIEVTEYYQ